MRNRGEALSFKSGATHVPSKKKTWREEKLQGILAVTMVVYAGLNVILVKT